MWEARAPGPQEKAHEHLATMLYCVSSITLAGCCNISDDQAEEVND
jgi:hypothetical protein